MILYIYSKCSTCQNALKFLERKNISFVRKEIVETPPSVEELRTMFDYQDGHLKKLFNTSGLLYKKLELKDKLQNLNIDQAFALLHQHGMLVKRPFLLGDDFGLLGFKETEWSQKI